MIKIPLQIEPCPSYINRPLPEIDNDDSDASSIETNNGFNENLRQSIRSMPPNYLSIFPKSSIMANNDSKLSRTVKRSKSHIPTISRVLFKERQSKLSQSHIETPTTTQNKETQIRQSDEITHIIETLTENPLVEITHYSEEPPICYNDLYSGNNHSTNIQTVTNELTPQNRLNKLTKQLKILAKQSFYIRHLILVVGLSFFSIFTQIILSNFLLI